MNTVSLYIFDKVASGLYLYESVYVHHYDQSSTTHMEKTSESSQTASLTTESSVLKTLFPPFSEKQTVDCHGHLKAKKRGCRLGSKVELRADAEERSEHLLMQCHCFQPNEDFADNGGGLPRLKQICSPIFVTSQALLTLERKGVDPDLV